MIDVITEICNRIWRTGVWHTPLAQSLIITLHLKGNLQLCQNYRTISVISHSGKVMLNAVLNKLRLFSELKGAPQNRFSTVESFVKSTSRISRICAMSYLISKKPSTEYDVQTYGPPCGSKISVQTSSHRWTGLWQGYNGSPDEWQHWIIVQNNSRGKATMSSVTHPLQHFSRMDHVWCSGSAWWKRKHRQQKYYQSAVCKWQML